MQKDANQWKDKNIVFFDGICALCNGFVDFTIIRDKKKQLFFAPLQGQTFISIQKKYPLNKNIDSIIFFKDGKYFDHSSAAIEITTMIGGIWPVFKVFYLFPKIIRDSIYRLIAANRYKWFGKYDTCRLPDPEFEDRFYT